MATLTRRDFRAIIYYILARGLSKGEFFKEISELFGEDCPSVRTVDCWYLQFRRGNFVLDDQPRTERPSVVATPESVDAVRKAIILKRRITYKQLEELLDIPKSTLERIVSEQLSVRKLCTLRVPHALFDEQRENGVKWSKKRAEKFKSGFASECELH